jgi:hypothetical protein
MMRGFAVLGLTSRTDVASFAIDHKQFSGFLTKSPYFELRLQPPLIG